MTILLNASTVITFKTNGRPSTRSVVIPSDDVVPWDLTSFIPEPHLLRNGWPDVPPIWVRGYSLASSTGAYLDASRPDPYSVYPNGHARWIASDVAWDEIAQVWNPYYSNGISYTFDCPGLPPVVERISYLAGSEMLYRDALRLYPGVVLVSDFNAGRDDASVFGVSLVTYLHSPTGYPILYIGGNHPIQIDVSDAIYLTFNGKTARVPTLGHPAASVPMYLVLAVTPTTATLTVGPAVNKMTTIVMNRPQAVTTDLQMIIGSTSAASSNASMHLLDFSIFDERTTDREVLSQLTCAYGSGS